jgi:hypothetical protein
MGKKFQITKDSDPSYLRVGLCIMTHKPNFKIQPFLHSRKSHVYFTQIRGEIIHKGSV